MKVFAMIVVKAFTTIMAKTFIKMIELNTKLTDTAAEIYSHVVRKEMELDAQACASSSISLRTTWE